MGRRGRGMNILLILLFCIIILIGGIYAGFARDPYAKLIAIGIIGGGIMPLIVARGYVDVAAALAVIIPLSTIFVLQLCKKGAE
jgi:energy-converting hydrogenase A subunit D